MLFRSNLNSNVARHTSNTFLVAVDEKTQVTRAQDNSTSSGIGKDSGRERDGVLYGLNPALATAYIELHQGIDNLNKPSTVELSPELKEEGYVIQIDGRFGSIVDTNGSLLSEDKTTQDDDGFLFYTVSTDNPTIVSNLGTSNDSPSPLLGSRGTRIQFKIKASSVLTDNQSYFDRFGFTLTVHSKTCKAIDSIVRITGLKTGYSVDIPVRFIKDVTP